MNQAVGVTAPWSVPTGDPSLWLSATTLPSTGTNLAVAVLNPTGIALSYGVLGSLERWGGHGWVSIGTWGGNLDQWGGFGKVIPESDSASALAIGLSAPVHGVGDVEYVAVPPLKQGWYRLGVDGAFGVLRVDAGPSTAPDVTDPPTLTANPALLPASGGEVQIVGFPPPTGVQTLAGVMQFNQALAPSVILQRAEGSSWRAVATLHVHPPSQEGYPAAAAVTIPSMPAGSYRLVRHSPSLGDLERQIWLLPKIPGVQLGVTASA